MTTPSLNGNLIPDSIGQRGRYTWQPPEIVAVNGRGEAVTAPFSTVTWQWDYLTLADYTWLIATVLNEAGSVTSTTGTILVDHLQRAVAVSCVIMRPTYSHISGGLYQDVELKITRIEASTSTIVAGAWLGSGYPPTYTP